MSYRFILLYIGVIILKITLYNFNSYFNINSHDTKVDAIITHIYLLESIDDDIERELTVKFKYKNKLHFAGINVKNNFSLKTGDTITILIDSDNPKDFILSVKPPSLLFNIPLFILGLILFFNPFHILDVIYPDKIFL